jgi:hypothetical protein
MQMSAGTPRMSRAKTQLYGKVTWINFQRQFALAVREPARKTEPSRHSGERESGDTAGT